MCKGGGVSKFLCKYTLPTACAGESKAKDVSLALVVGTGGIPAPGRYRVALAPGAFCTQKHSQTLPAPCKASGSAVLPWFNGLGFRGGIQQFIPPLPWGLVGQERAVDSQPQTL